MLQSLNRLTLASLFLLSTVVSADAALITISEQSTGGGTLVHDGTGDVSSSDGSAQGNALLMSSFGITNGNLANDLGLFSITGLITDGDGLATSANLNILRLIGTLNGNPLPSCATCATLNDVRVGSSLSLGAAGNTQNVLFAFDIVGALSGMPWGVTPAGLSSPQNVPIGQNFVYTLTPAQISFIVGRMSGFTVNQVRFGIAASAVGLVPPTSQTDVRLAFDLQGPVPVAVPEPGTLLLLGSGMAAAVCRRRRRSQLH